MNTLIELPALNWPHPFSCSTQKRLQCFLLNSRNQKYLKCCPSSDEKYFPVFECALPKKQMKLRIFSICLLAICIVLVGFPASLFYCLFCWTLMNIFQCLWHELGPGVIPVLSGHKSHSWCWRGFQRWGWDSPFPHRQSYFIYF